MGSLLSLCTNPCDYVDNTMNNLIFHPPHTRKDLFQNLNTKKSELLSTFNKNYEEISFVKITPKIPFTKYVVFSHGNAEDIFTGFGFGLYLSEICNIGCIFYDYSGYGLSEGKLSEQGCYDSLDAVMDYMINTLNIETKNIVLMGQSLGTGVAIHYAAQNDWKSPIILISPYKSIATVVTDSSCGKLVDKFTTLSKLDNLTCPIKIFHGKEDELINIEHGECIYDNIKNKTFSPTWMDFVGHNNILSKIDERDLKPVFDYVV